MGYISAVGHILIIAFLKVLQTTHSIEISVAEKYIVQNRSYIVTCSYNSFQNDRTAVYNVQDGFGNGIATYTVRYLNSTGQCYQRTSSYVPCTADVCYCDRDGMATHIRYNHTSNVTGILNFACSSGNGSSEKIPVADGPDEKSMTFKPPNKDVTHVAGEPLVQIECKVKCIPDCQFQWKAPSGIFTTGSTLTIMKLTKDDHGIYQCEARNNVTEKTETINLNLTVNYGPDDVALSPLNTTYADSEGEDLGPVTCSAECRPPCTYRWFGPDVPNGTTNILKLLPLTRYHKGSFFCNVSNPVTYKSGVSSNVTIDVLYGPGQIQFDPNNTAVIKVKDQTLGPVICSASCNPPCLYEWKIPDNTKINVSKLFIEHLTLDHHGEYRCTAGNEIANTSRNLTVTVNYGPDNVNLEPSQTKYTKREGDKLGLVTCNAGCRPLCTYTWFGPDVPNGTTNVLNLKSLKRNHNGSFYCKISNLVTNATAVSPNITIDVQYGPGSSIQFNINNTNVIKLKGQQLGPITCSASCNPVCVYKWTMPDQKTIDDQVLLIETLIVSHHGVFQCAAENEIGKKSKDINVTVNYGPENVTLMPSFPEHTVPENTNVGPVNCVSDCRPSCRFSWSGLNLHSTMKSLLIQNVQRNQTGNYYCTSTNPYSNLTMNSTSIRVDVQYIAVVTELKINSTNMTVSENTAVEFSCIYDGNPIPSIAWLQNEEVVDTHKILDISQKSILTIKSANCYDIGNYTCMAANIIGNSSKGLSLYVNCSPRSLNDLKDSVAIKNKTSALNLTVEFISFPKPTYIKWFFSKNQTGNREPVPDKLIYNTNHVYRHNSKLLNQELTNEDYGYYTVEINNGIGNAFNHVFNVVSETVPDIPYNVTVVCEDSPSSAVIRWRSEFNGGQDQTFNIWFRVYSKGAHTYEKYPGTILDPGTGDFESLTLINLLPATPYVFYVSASNINGYSLSKQVYCNTTLASDRTESTSSVLGAATGATSAAVVLVAVIIVLVIFRKIHKGKDTKDKRCLTETNGTSLDELPDNPDYISADSVTYSVVTKNRTCQHSPDLQMQYEDVAISGPDVSNTVNSEAEYAAIVKKNSKGNENRNQQKKKKEKKKKEKDGSGQIELGDIYMNTENTRDVDVIGEEYANTGDRDNNITYKSKKNKDGLIYADLDLVPTPIGKKFIIRGLENRNNYAIIDLTKSAEPLPSDDDEEEENNAD